MNSLNPQKVQQAVKYIDTWLEFNFNNSRIPGMQVAIQHKDNVVYSRSFGYADVAAKKKLTNKHVLRVASQSKTFTATALMQLQEAGKLSLDDKVSKHLGWFMSASDKRVADVTIRQLANHTAGLIRDGEDADFWQLLHDFPDEKELKKSIERSRLFYDSDERFKYSNFGYGYLGLVIEAVSGMSYRNYVAKHIVKALKLTTTGADMDAIAEKLLAKGYGLELFRKERRVLDHVDTRDLSAATGFYSNAEDMCRYFSAHFLGNGQLLTDASKRTMQHGYWKPEGAENQRYGLGMISYKKKGWHLFGHSGGFPGFITNSRFDPKLQLVVSVLTNGIDGPAPNISEKIVDIIDTFQQDTDDIKKRVKAPATLESRFFSLWNIMDIVFVGNKPFAVEPKGWAAFDTAEELSVVNDHTLKIEKANGYSSPGEEITFKFDDQGKVVSVSNAGTTMLPWQEAVKQGWFSDTN